MILDKNYNFALVEITEGRAEVKLFNESVVNGFPRRQRYMVNVKVWTDGFGRLCIEGKEHEYHYTERRIDITQLDGTPAKKCIKHQYGVYLFYWEIQKPYSYVQGWYFFPCKKESKYIFTHYTIEVLP